MVLLFASMDRGPTPLITKEINRLSTALKPLNIAVQWYALREHKFEPDARLWLWTLDRHGLLVS